MLARLMLVALVLVLAAGAAACSPGSDDEAAGPAGQRLDLISWAGYVEDGSDDPRLDWVTPFERASGCRVDARVVSSSDEVVELLGTGRYDGAAVPGEAIGRVVGAGLVAPLDLREVPRFASVYPGLQRTPSNSVGRRVFGVPQGRGATLLLSRADVVRPAPAGWEAVFDPRSPYRGRVTAQDSPLTIADAALHLRSARPELGIRDPYRLDARQFAAAVGLARRQRELVGTYWSDTVRAQAAFAAGTAVLGAGWQPVVDLLRADGVPVRAVLPREGATGHTDSWMLARRADNPDCMERWMNWMLSPRVNAAVAESFGIAPAVPGACRFTRDRGHCDRYHANDERWFARVELPSTPQRACGDARGNVCTTWDEWVEAWDEID